MAKQIAKLHALWLPPYTLPSPHAGLFAVWGELAYKNIPAAHAVHTHPFAAPTNMLSQAVLRQMPYDATHKSLHHLIALHQSLPVLLPSLPFGPLASWQIPLRRTQAPPTIALWEVPALALTAEQALQWLLTLSNIPEKESVRGPSIQFWHTALRLLAQLLHAGTFLPNADDAGHGQWQLTMPTTHLENALDTLAATMPPSARNLQYTITPPADLLYDFLNALANAFIQDSYGPTQTPFRLKSRPPRPADRWQATLMPRMRDAAAILTNVPPHQPDLADAVHTWINPTHAYLTSPARLALRLEPPTVTEATSDAALTEPWQLSFHVHQAGDPEFLWAATEIWENPPRADLPAVLHNGLALAAPLFPPLAPARTHPTPTSIPLDIEQVVDLLENQAEALTARNIVMLLPTWWHARRRRLQARITVQSPKESVFGLHTLVEFDWNLALGDMDLTPAEFERLAQSKTALVQVRGQWLAFDPHDVQAVQRVLQRQKQAGPASRKLTLRDALGLSLGGVAEWEGLQVSAVATDARLTALTQKLTERRQIEVIPQPTEFKGELRHYQQRGLSWLTFMQRFGFGACLADDMGLGKTIQTLALLLHGHATGTLTGPALLVCPTTVVANWMRELEQFAPSLRGYAHHGPTRAKDADFAEAARAHDLVITSYALLPRDRELLEGVPWSALILDEAHNIKNPTTKQAQTARALPAGFRLALTGTPIENSLQDLWSLMHFLNPGYLGSAETFQHRFVLPIERDQDAQATTRLRALTGPFILRRVKTDPEVIQDLPPKNELKEYCGLTKEQAALYRAVVQESLRQIAAASGMKRRGIVLATLTKLKQVCNHPRHLLDDASALPRRSGKLNRLTEMLEEALAEDDRVLIFTQYAEMGKLLREYLSAQFETEALFLFGGTPAKQRTTLIERFQNGDARLFILSLKAGGAGINLTRANRVFHYDRWWNPAVENQATDRAFRIGQTRTVYVHKFICRGTLEERIDELVERKLALAEQVVSSGESWLTELSTDDLRNLLTLREDAIDD